MKINREDVVKAALLVETWCTQTYCNDCPFYNKNNTMCMISVKDYIPSYWDLAEYLRKRGTKHE